MNVTESQSATRTAPQTPVAQASSTKSIATDFDTFLQMLTAQARYQDPLEPIDSSEYAAQLAQFSMVEQQVQTNQAIEALTAKLTENGLQGLSGWMGMEVRAALPQAFDGTALTLDPRVDANADRALLVVYDDAGTEVQRIDIPPESAPYTWDGKDADGLALPVGAYRFEVESWVDQTRTATRAVETYRQVAEIQSEGGLTELILSDGSRILASDATALRRPED